jgi:hypothetical protein
MRAGELRKAIACVRQNRSVERTGAIIEQAATGTNRGTMVADGEIGDGGGACSGNDEGQGHRIQLRVTIRLLRGL